VNQDGPDKIDHTQDAEALIEELANKGPALFCRLIVSGLPVGVRAQHFERADPPGQSVKGFLYQSVFPMALTVNQKDVLPKRRFRGSGLDLGQVNIPLGKLT
jgi:hypothetical protein